jgi:hypothetical protein
MVLIFVALVLPAAAVGQTPGEAGPPEWMEGIETPEVTAPVTKEPEPEKVDSSEFVDVPEDHWAKGAVYDLVKLGITQGYPDGTFRGGKRISRYEMAMFISRMSGLISQMMEDVALVRKKEYEEKYEPKLRAALDEIRMEIELLKEPEVPRPEFGYFSGRLKAANFTSIGGAYSTRETAVGPGLDWRLKMSFEGGVNEWLYGEANFDTMDVGWGGSADRRLVTSMIDVSGRAKTPWDDISIIFTVGPGPIVHNEVSDSAFRSDNGVAFMRPQNSFGVEGNFRGADWLVGYSTTRISQSGEVDVSNYKMKYGYDFDEDISFLAVDEIYATLDYNVRGGLDPAEALKEKLNFKFSPKWGFSLSVGAGLSSVQSTGENYYYELGMGFRDLLKKGMSVDLSAVRIGSEFLNYPEDLGEEIYLGVNYFDKLLYVPGGGADIGLRIINEISEAMRLSARGGLVLDDNLSYGDTSPGTYSTFEIKMDYITYTHSTFGLVYRIHHEPSFTKLPTSDMLALSLKYEF